MGRPGFLRLFAIGLLILLGIAILGIWAVAARMFYTPVVTQAAALADLDGDGDLDVFLANGRNESTTASSVWINTINAQDGRWFKPSPYLIGSWNYLDAALGDLDRDGDVDALLISDHALEVYLNQGRENLSNGPQFKALGSKQNLTEFWAGSHPVALGDLDGDGDLDALTGHCCGGWATNDQGSTPLPPVNGVWINHLEEGRLYLEPVPLPSLEIAGSEAVALGDLDGDGDLDAFIGNAFENNLQVENPTHNTPDWVWWNDGAGNFTDSGQRLGSRPTYAAALGDLDGDGDLDIFSAGEAELYIWLNQAGIFAQADQRLKFDGRPISAFLGDLDGDGDLDGLLDTRDPLSSGMVIWHNDGQGNFAQRATIPHPQYHAAVPGDLDGDGDLDIFSGRGHEEYSIWFNDGQGVFAFPVVED